MILKIKNEFIPKVIILFGSYSLGKDVEESDVDLFVETKEREIDIKKIEKKLERRINLFF